MTTFSHSNRRHGTRHLGLLCAALLLAWTPATGAQGVPGAPLLTAPSGAGVSATPTYSWQEITGADDYYLWVNGPGGTPVIQEWLTGAGVCSGGTCAASPATSLSLGAHTWWVQARNAAGTGPWSSGMSFLVGTLPAAPVLVAPSGPGTPATPTYSWQEVAGADDYYLWVNDSAGSPVVQQWLPASGVCAGGTCAATPSTPLSLGAHTWWVQARSAVGTGPWSGGMSFLVGNLPGPPTLIAPNGAGVSPTPTYSWGEVAGAEDYYLWVNGPAGAPVIQQWLPGTSACSAGICAATPATALSPGPHSWWVQARSAVGTGPWSAGMTFLVGTLPAAPVLVSPSGQGVSGTPTYSWQEVQGADDYYLWVNGPAGTPVIQQWLSGTSACAGGACSVTPTTSLSQGPHTWWVQARSAVGVGPWSAGMAFLVGELPVAPVLIEPNGQGVSATPTFSWQEVAGASDYYLWVNGPGGTAVIQQWVQGASVCAGAVCSATPSGTLTPGPHNWWVQARSAVGTGPWSAGMSFLVGNLPGAPALLSPSVHAFARRPEFVWTAVAEATEYHLWVNGPGGSPVIQQWLPAASICPGSECRALSSAILADGNYQWWVQARSAVGDGPWSAGLAFTLHALGTIAAGHDHSLAVSGAGEPWAWGLGDRGQLGNGGGANASVPTLVPALSGVREIRGGDGYTLALLEDGTVLSWGTNDRGQLGDGTAIPRATAAPVPGLQHVRSIAAGGAHALAILEDGSVVAWGANDAGQVGIGTTIDQRTPTQVPGLTGVLGVAAGAGHSLALTNSGAVYGWGLNASGELGDGSLQSQSSPTQVPALAGVRLIASGPSAHTSFAATSAGQVFAWGANADGQLGLGTLQDQSTPQLLSTLSDAKAIAAGEGHTLVADALGRLWAFGRDDEGQLGSAGSGGSTTPVQVAGLAGVVQVAAGFAHSLALTQDGQVFGWGRNSSGQVGDGSLTQADLPVQLSEADFGWIVAAPVFSPPPGSYVGSVSVGLATATPGAVVHVTTDGSEPTQASAPYVGPITLTVDTTLRARAFKTGSPQSRIASGTYTVSQGGILADPVLTPPGGAYLAPLTVGISGPGGAEIHYTTDGSEPGLGSPTYLGPFNLVAGATVKAQAHRAGWAPSAVVSADYTLQAASPVASVPAGSYDHPIEVHLSSATPGVAIHYTLDGADPTDLDPILAPGQAIVIDQDLTLSAVALGPGLLPSAIGRFPYTFSTASPSFSPPGGIYAASQTVSVASATPGAEIHYTLDGSEPTAASPTYLSPLAIDVSTTVRAIAVTAQWGSSAPSAARYVIDAGLGRVEGGNQFTGAIDAAGQGWTWGGNDRGQLGDGSTTPRSYPGLYGGPVGLYRMALGQTHGLALTRTGEVWSWGGNTTGQLGDGGTADRPTPARVVGVGPVVAVAAGAWHSLALDNAGHVWAWGDNTQGQLGTGTTEGALTPVRVPNLEAVVAIAAGDEHSLAVDSQGRVWSWGADDRGQLGLGWYQSVLVPTEVTGVAGATGVAAGGRHSLALMADGTAWAWGANEFGQTGTGAWDWDVLLPAQVSTEDCTEGCWLLPLGDLRSVSARGSISTAITLTGSVYAWGATAGGGSQAAATLVPFPLQAVEASAGTSGVIVRTDQDEVWSRGENTAGEVGDWTTTPRADLVSIAAPGFAWRAGAPVFSPAPGTYGAELDLMLSSPTPGAVVQYTTDGTTPGEGSPVFPEGGSLPIADPVAVAALATATGWAPSNVSVGTYDFSVGAVALNPPPGDYDVAQSIVVTATTPGTDLHYTVDGAEPTLADPQVASGGVIPMTASFTLRVRGFKGSWQPADAGGLYRLAAQAPVFSPPPGSYQQEIDMTISAPTPGAAVRYTTDGTQPSVGSPQALPGVPIHVSRSLQIRAIAFHGSLEASAEAVGDYALVASPPVFSPPPGTYTEPQLVSLLASAPGAVVRYEIGGAWVSHRSPIFSGPILVDADMTIRAAVFKEGWGWSGVVDGTYVLGTPAVSAPTLTPVPGTFATRQAVTVATVTPGADIHYTVDGTEPTSSSPGVASGGTVTVDRNTILKVRAWDASGTQASATRTGTYLITGAVSAGENFTIALKADRTVWSWGRNDSGELGTGAGPSRSLPGQITGLSDVVAISAGGSHSLALKADGTVMAWGANSFGQLGNGDQVTQFTPVPVPGLSSIVAIAAGGSHSLALRSNGDLYAWGRNTWGQLGNGNTSSHLSPTLVQLPYGMSPITAIAAGAGHSLALSGGLYGAWAWGGNYWGQVNGVPDSGVHPHPTPTLYGPVARIVGGSDVTLAIQSDGAVAGRVVAIGEADPDIGDATNIAAGGAGSLATRSSGTVWQWDSGAALPSRVFGADDAVDLTVGGHHFVALFADGSLKAWGYNFYGELGNGTQSPSDFPVEVSGLRLVDNDAWVGLDSDGDGLNDADELRWGADRFNPDTNGDGIRDGDAVRLGLSPTNPDMDFDGLTNVAERASGTDPFRFDTDGDGVGDGADCRPLDPTTTTCSGGDPNDVTPPTITLWAPPNALLIQSLP